MSKTIISAATVDISGGATTALLAAATDGRDRYVRITPIGEDPATVFAGCHIEVGAAAVIATSLYVPPNQSFEVTLPSGKAINGIKATAGVGKVNVAVLGG